MMRVYPNRGAEHSASGIVVKYRGFETQYQWTSFLDRKTRNHGTQAGAMDMSLYALCDMYPHTIGFYAWKGECQGKWGLDHVCNDDTVLQLYHAAGNWSGGSHCPITHRKLAPYCDALWSNNGTQVFRASKTWGLTF